MREERDQRERDEEYEEREVVERRGPLQVDAEGRRTREARKPVVPAGHAHPSVREPPEDLPQRERDHEEAQAARAQGEHPVERGDDGRDRERDRTRGEGPEPGAQR